MPAATDLRGGEATRGIWIRRASSRAATRPRRLVRAEDNKENVPPEGWVESTPWRRRVGKGPLPEWYPRTPLRDITNIVNAVERRRRQEQAAAMAARENRNTQSSPEDSTQEPRVIGHDEHFDSTPNTIPTGIASSSPVEHPLPTPSMSSSNSLDQIEKMVKKNNFKNKKKNAEKASDKKRHVQRKTLMSMR